MCNKRIFRLTLRHTFGQITSLARSGSLDQAWSIFESAGFVADPSPAALAVKGRLLKDRALRAEGDARIALLADAEHAYAAADAATPAPYLLINVATLAALQGHDDRAARLAGEVLARLDGEVAETPYYLAATRAEAELLRGDRAASEAALAEAAELHPEGWEERAGTLRQLGLILEVTGCDAAWLDGHRPPASLHFAGHLGVPEGDSDALRAAVADILDAHRIGVGFGALAAGADIVIAEALIARGAELHLVLPGNVEAFAGYSIAPYGGSWPDRFRACLADAASVRIAARSDHAHATLATALAAETAMGSALLHARRFETHAVQLLIADEGDGRFGSGPNTARDGETWSATGSAQHVLRWRRDPAAPRPTEAPGAGGRALMAVLLVGAGDRAVPSEDAFEIYHDELLAPLWSALATIPTQPRRRIQHGNALLLAFDTPAEAAECALELHALPITAGWPLRIAGAYGVVHAGSGVTGVPVAIADALASVVRPGTTTVTDLFASALAVHSARDRAEWIGDFDLPGMTLPAPLFALSRG